MSEHSTKTQLSPSVAIIIAGIIIAGAIVFTNSSRPAAVGAGNNNPADSTIDVSKIRKPSASDHIIGSPNAPIVLIEYSDFQCPYCQVIHPTLTRIVEESDGQIAWVYRHLPLTTIHPQAEPSALASECITEQLGNNGFWQFATQMFGNQSKLSESYYTQVAGQLGADTTKFNQCVSTLAHKSKVDTDAQEVQSVGGTGTPYVIVLNTKTDKAAVVPGALPYDGIKSVIKSVQ